MTADEIAVLADRVRREYGAEFPPGPVRESAGESARRQEATKYVLETVILAKVNQTRVAERSAPLSEDDEDRVVESILSAMFLLPGLLAIAENEPLGEDVVVLGSDGVRVDRADGTIGMYPPLVAADRDLETVISNVATAHHRPFSFENPYVDVQLSPRMRFHGQGFDVVARPAIFIRIHRVMGATLDDLFGWGAMSAGIRYLLQTVVPEVGLSAMMSGEQGSGKTTVLRAQALAYPTNTRIVTIETDFELGLAGLGMTWTQEMQSRIPMTTAGRGISSADQIAPMLRSRPQLAIIGEVRGNEGAAAVRAANVGQGTLITVHGRSAEAGLEQLVDRVTEDSTPRELARRMVYKAFDLVVQCAVGRDRSRWVSEILVPSLEGDRPVLHTLYSAHPGSSDRRARANRAPWPDQFVATIEAAYPEFDMSAALDDTYQPLHTATPATPVLRAVGS